MEALNLTTTNLTELVFFLLPGFIAVYLFFYQIPDRKKSNLTIIVLSVIGSVTVTYLAKYLFSLLNFITAHNFHLSDDNQFFGFTRISFAIILPILLSRFVQSETFKIINSKLFNVRSFPFGRLWNAFFNTPKNTAVKVFLNNGICYIGVIHRVSYDPEDVVQELELWTPFYFDKNTTRLTRISETESVLIQGNSISSIEKISQSKSRELYK